MPHRAVRGGQHLDRNDLVRRDHGRDPVGEDPRRTVPAADQTDAPSRISGSSITRLPSTSGGSTGFASSPAWETPGTGQPAWAALMARKRRKTLVVCHPCHETIHHSQPAANTA
ncbi:hypothetical protein [Saccharopolyspora sp. ASAGF58]|uniref:HNH endonuclease n=1 Tax=Saccharopolyspora sp. ASAGF58 TaxID=2719023 RepID=UPI00352FF001